MARRKERQKRGYLGHRSHGRGNVKNRRGSGNRGGRGMAGVDKHKWSWAVNHFGSSYFGKSGFVRPVGKETRVAHLYEINQQALLNQLHKKGSRYVFEFDGKILATGAVTVPLEIKAASWSRNVEEKLKAAGGEISALHPEKAAAKHAPAKAEEQA